MWIVASIIYYVNGRKNKMMENDKSCRYKSIPITPLCTTVYADGRVWEGEKEHLHKVASNLNSILELYNMKTLENKYWVTAMKEDTWGQQKCYNNLPVPKSRGVSPTSYGNKKRSAGILQNQDWFCKDLYKYYCTVWTWTLGWSVSLGKLHVIWNICCKVTTLWNWTDFISLLPPANSETA